MISVNEAGSVLPIKPALATFQAPMQDRHEPDCPPTSQGIHHFPLDKNLAYLRSKQIFDINNRIIPTADLSAIDPRLPKARMDFLKEFLFKERKLNLKGKKGTIILNISLAKLLKFFDGQNRIVGGYAKYIFGSGWFGAIAAALQLPDINSPFFKKMLHDMDCDDIDIDLQHINSSYEREISQIKFFQFLAKCTLPANASEEQIKKAYDEITQGGSFKDITSFFYVENKKVVGDANRITLQIEGLHPVDFIIGRILSRGFITSVQDFTLVVDSLLDKKPENTPEVDLIPTGETHQGMQAVLDCLCKTYQFEKWDTLAWARTLLYNSKMSRYPELIPAEIYDNLHNKCNEEKSVANTLHYLVKLVSKHKTNPEVLLFLTYNACADLIKHGFSSEDLRKFSQKMLREEVYPEGPLRILQRALITLPFEITASVVELILILKLSSKNNQGIYLTQHDGTSCIMTFLGDYNLLQTINPEQAIQKLTSYAFNQEGLEIVKDLCKYFELNSDYKRDFHSAIDQYSKYLNWNWEALTLQLIPLINKSKELDLIINLFWLLCTGSTRDAQYHPLDIISAFLRSWTPLDSIDASKLWDLYTKDMNEKELLAFSESVFSKAVHPKLALHILKDLIGKMSHLSPLPQLLKRICNCAFMRQYDDLLAFLHCIKHIQKKSEKLNVLSQDFLHFWIEKELRNNPEKGKDLLLLCLKNQLLPVGKNLAPLWIVAVEVFYDVKDMETALTLWSMGDDYGLWSEGCLRKDKRGFLVSFADSLFDLHSTKADAAVCTLLDVLPDAKDTLKSRVEALKLERDTRLKDLRKTHAALKTTLLSFEAVLKTSTNDRENQLKSALNIFDSLSVNFLNHQDNLANLTEAKLLLSNPRVISLFDSCLSTYLDIILKFLERSEKMQKSRRIDHTIIPALLELYFRYLPSTKEPSELVLALFIDLTKVEVPRALKDEVIRNMDRIIEILKNNKRMKEVCHISKWQGNGLSADQRKELDLWILQATSENITREEFSYGLSYLTSNQNTYPLNSAQPLQLNCFIKIARHLIASEQIFAARIWINKAIDLTTGGNSLATNGAEKILFDWFKQYKECQNPQTAAPFLEVLYEKHPEMRGELFNFFNNENDQFINDKPELYIKLLHHCSAKGIDTALTKKINGVFKLLLKDTKDLKGNTYACLSFFNRENELIDVSYNPLLRAVLKINDCCLKIKALSIALSRISLISMGILDNQERLNDWMQSLLSVIELTDQLRQMNIFNVNYSKISLALSSLIFDREDRFIDLRNRLLPPQELPKAAVRCPIRVVQKKGIKEIDRFVRDVIRLNIETLRSCDEDEATYKTIAESIVQILGLHGDLINSEEESFKLVFRMLLVFGVSHIPEIYHSGVVHLSDEFNTSDPERLRKLTDVFDLYLNRIKHFPNKKITIDKLTKLSAWLALHLPLANQEKLYPTLVNLYSSFPAFGDYLLPSQILKNFKLIHLIVYLARHLFLETPYGIFSLAILYMYLRKNSINLSDITLWATFFAGWNKIIKPRYGSESRTNRPAPSPQQGPIPILEAG